MITIKLKYPLTYFDVLNEILSNLIISLNGTVNNSGTELRYKSMEINFLSKIDLDNFLTKIRDLEYLIICNIISQN
ncbi:MAG TPA: hypothetical protein V6C58_02315 [Allocoleopsis sp.]